MLLTCNVVTKADGGERDKTVIETLAVRPAFDGLEDGSGDEEEEAETQDDHDEYTHHSHEQTVLRETPCGYTFSNVLGQAHRQVLLFESDIRQNDQLEGDANQRVHDAEHPPTVCLWGNIAIAYTSTARLRIKLYM
jgi:hypothetical protein